MSWQREIIVAFMLLLLWCSPSAGIPAFPSEFYGEVSIGGEPAPAGTLIAALINGEERGRVTTTVAGAYGGPDTFDRRLVVQGAQDEAGAEIAFEINGVRTDETAAFSPGEVIALDLSASALPPTAAPTTTAAPARTTSQPESTVTAGLEEPALAASPVSTSPESPVTGGTDWPETTAPTTTAAPSATIAAPAGVDTSLSPLWDVILVLSAVIVLLAVMLVRKKS